MLTQAIMTPPTCEQLFNEELGDPVSREDDTSWRHGSNRTEVYHRESDDTFWQAKYQVSTDGEYHGLRHGIAPITQVWPVRVTKTEYVTKKPGWE